MDKQGRITNISEVKIGGEYRWKKGSAIDPDRIIVTERPEGRPYLVANVNGLQINLWHWRGRLLPWTNAELSHGALAPLRSASGSSRLPKTSEE